MRKEKKPRKTRQNWAKLGKTRKTRKNSQKLAETRQNSVKLGKTRAIFLKIQGNFGTKKVWKMNVW